MQNFELLNLIDDLKRELAKLQARVTDLEKQQRSEENESRAEHSEWCQCRRCLSGAYIS
jgi:hypothetical protein